MSVCGHAEVHLVRGGAAGALDDVGGRPDAAADCHVQGPALHILGQEAADKSVAGPVGVNDLVGRQLLGRECENLHRRIVSD